VGSEDPTSGDGSRVVQEDEHDYDEEREFTPAVLHEQGKTRVLKIPRGNETRWSSTYYMLARVWLLRKALVQYAVELCVVTWELTPAVCERIGDLVDLLGPIADLTTEIQSEREPTVHLALPALLRLACTTITNPGA